MQTEYFRIPGSQNNSFEKINNLMKQYIDDSSVKSGLIEEYYKLIGSGALIELLRDFMTKIKSDTKFSPLWISSTECPIVAHSNSVLSFRCFAPKNEIDSVYASPGTIIISLLSENPVDVEVYHGEQETETQSLLRRVTLKRNESVVITKGQSFRIFSDGRSALLSRLLLDLGEYIPVYDAATLEYISMVSLSPSSSRWYFMARVAGQLPTEDALPILHKLVEHSNYHVRWSALQELFSHDVSAALVILNKFKTDPSEYISEQARSEATRIEAVLSDA